MFPIGRAVKKKISYRIKPFDLASYIRVTLAFITHKRALYSLVIGKSLHAKALEATGSVSTPPL